MPRIIKEFSVRRNEILASAQKLIYTRGFEQMTIQNILDELQISKGAFYHYFDSKQALLEALIERMTRESEQIVLPIVNDPQMPALEKFKTFFSVSAKWKLERKAFFLELLRVWYKDENLMVRHKLRAAGMKSFAPLLQTIIQQGIQEGFLNARYPEMAAKLLISMGDDLGDSVSVLILAPEPEIEKLPQLTAIINAYSDAFERIIGAPTGSLQLLAPEHIKEWMTD
ncbi:MAG: TetR/AcrR family transcriptional regulator [Chloroflexota bacterium]